MAEVIARDFGDRRDILGCIQYWQQHNRQAYLSHRKRALRRLRSRRKKR
jgi:hypothetical protein